MIANSLNVIKTIEGGAVVTLTINKISDNDISILSDLSRSDKKLDVSIKEHRKKRSLDANSYFWVLCDKLAYKLNTTKEEIYFDAIYKVGVFNDLVIKTDAIKEFRKHYSSNGIGWFIETRRDSKQEGYKIIRAYCGSSSYNTQEMSRLINYIIDECHNQGIETMTDTELTRLIEMW